MPQGKLVTPKDNWYRITPPTLWLHNDPLELYVRQLDDGKMELSDDGEIFWELDAINLGFREQRLEFYEGFERLRRKYNLYFKGTELRKKFRVKDFWVEINLIMGFLTEVKANIESQTNQ
jgi:hypothetical protein